jgi:hypothetical protein
MSDEASSSGSEINQIEEIFQIQDNKTINPKDNISTEVRIQCFSKNSQHLLLGLLDTGATGIFIKRKALSKTEHQVKHMSLKVKGRYSQSHLKQISIFDIRLPDYCGNCCVTAHAYVEDESIGRHDIVVGMGVIKQLGLRFDFKRCTVTWDEITTPMVNMDPSIQRNCLQSTHKIWKRQRFSNAQLNTWNAQLHPISMATIIIRL